MKTRKSRTNRLCGLILIRPKWTTLLSNVTPATSSLVALQSRMMGSTPYKYNSRSIKDEPQWDLAYYDMGVGMPEPPFIFHTALLLLSHGIPLPFGLDGYSKL
ncbi:uncharacterized protein CEXT_567691 [Caerostris extrusa]|uniref:Uncharacterized protein n=1 Tax=Caerostris extrusa TaxID=172846 RepID=A0AAV4R4N0_CAEEX|nr:uncharacterized protein CEXT_567691 [Caerostris extrusa]